MKVNPVTLNSARLTVLGTHGTPGLLAQPLVVQLTAQELVPKLLPLMVVW